MKVASALVAAVLAVILAGCGGPGGGTAATSDRSDRSPSSSSAGQSEAALAGAPKVGTCFNLDRKQTAAVSLDAPGVDCGSRHTHLVVETLPVDASEDLTDEQTIKDVGDDAFKGCRTAMRTAVGGTLRARRQSAFALAYFTPTAAQVADGARWVTCLIDAPTDTKLLPLPATTPFISSGGSLPFKYGYCLLIDKRSTPCTSPHVLYQTRSIEYPATGKVRFPKAKDPYTEACKRAFPEPDLRILGSTTLLTNSMDPGRFQRCFSLDLRDLKKHPELYRAPDKS